MTRPSPPFFSYGDGQQPMFGTETYEKPLAWLTETCETIEDWGCGMAWARQFVPGKYRGIDTSMAASQFADVICDLRDWKSEPDGIFMRHVLEHNLDWPDILKNAVSSFRKRFALVLFTPFSETHTKELWPAGLHDISFRKEEITDHFRRFSYTEEHLETATMYGGEHIFYVERPAAAPDQPD